MYRSTVGEHVIWKTEGIEEDTKEDGEGKPIGAQAAIYRYIAKAPRAKYGDRAYSGQEFKAQETVGDEIR